MSSQLVECLVAGIYIGTIYALLALSYVIVYKTSKALNFAAGSLLLAGGYITYTLVQGPFNQPLVLAVLESLVVVGGIGYLLQVVIARPLLNSPPDAVIIATFGADVVLQAAIGSNRNWVLHIAAITNYLSGSVKIAGYSVSSASLFSIGVALVLIAVIGVVMKLSRW